MHFVNYQLFCLTFFVVVVFLRKGVNKQLAFSFVDLLDKQIVFICDIVEMFTAGHKFISEENLFAAKVVNFQLTLLKSNKNTKITERRQKCDFVVLSGFLTLLLLLLAEYNAIKSQ